MSCSHKHSVSTDLSLLTQTAGYTAAYRGVIAIESGGDDVKLKRMKNDRIGRFVNRKLAPQANCEAEVQTTQAATNAVCC